MYPLTERPKTGNIPALNLRGCGVSWIGRDRARQIGARTL